MLLIATLIGAVRLNAGIFLAFLFMLLTAVCFVSIGLIIASQMKSTEGFQAIMSFLVMPLFFLSGALFPLQNTPSWMQAASRFDPLTYGIDGLRGSLIGSGMLPVWMDFIALLGFSAALVLLGSYLFRKSTI